MSMTSSILPGATSGRGVLENTVVANSPSTAVSTVVKEEENVNLPTHKPSPSISDAAMVRAVARSAVSSQLSTPLPPVNAFSSNGTIGAVASASDIIKRNAVVVDEKISTSGNVQPVVSPVSNRIILPQGVKSTDGAGFADSGSNGDSTIAGRVFSPPVVSGMQWRPGSSFNQNEAVYHNLVTLTRFTRFCIRNCGCLM